MIHLVSNSKTYDNNKPNDFKINYNTPFDLTGKQVALVDATFTKSHLNVMEEKIKFTFTRPPTIFRELSSKSRILASQSEEEYYEGYNQVVVPGPLADGPYLVYVVATYAVESGERTIKLAVHNNSDRRVRVTFIRKRRVGPDVKVWELVEANTHPVNKAAGVKMEQRTFLRPNGGMYEKWIVPRNKVGYFVFQNLPTVRDGPSINELTKFSVTASPPNSKKPIIFKPPSNHYQSVEDLVKVINHLPQFSDHAKLAFAHQRVTLVVKPDVKPCKVDLGGLERQFGFDNRILSKPNDGVKKFTAERPPDMSGGVHHFYIYCSLTKNVSVNEQLVPLLATVDATKGAYGEQVVHPIQFPLFLDCQEGPQQQVQVTIADDTGNSEGLLMGRTKLTLALRDKA